MIGFETIGNATLILHDDRPLLATDPWLSGRAYFGSWGLPYEIPSAQEESILGCRYVWISHGHPDHLDVESIARLTDKEFLLPDHVGGRIARDLRKLGLNVRILPDRKWVRISPHIEILCISDFYQDAILLANVNGRLLVNINDASDRGWGRSVRKIARRFPQSFLLKLFGHGDVDMNNFFDEDGRRCVPLVKRPLGAQISFWAAIFGTRWVVPFSSTHRYQRTDSLWANEWVASFEDYREGLVESRFELLPAFIRWDCQTDTFEEISPRSLTLKPQEPEAFGDSWSDVLGADDLARLQSYVRARKLLQTHFGFVRFVVGGKENLIEVDPSKRHVGISFEVPRTSLMAAVEHEIFDDLMIGNFMKATLHGVDQAEFDRYFKRPVCKLGDNGRAMSDKEVARYFATYRRRAPVEYVLRAFQDESERRFRNVVKRDSPLFEFAKRAYRRAQL